MDASNNKELSQILGRYHFSSVLLVYFQRTDKRDQDVKAEGLEELYDIDLDLLKSYLTQRPPHDKFLEKVIKIYN